MDDFIRRKDAVSLAKDIIVPTKYGYDYRHRCIDPEAIEELPAADVRPVVRGKWIEKERAHYFKCSICKTPIPYRFGYTDSRRYYNFCPNCGADMRKPDA